MSRIQAVLFDRKIYTLASATAKIYNMGFKPIKKAHVTNDKIRFRLEDPDNFDHFVTLRKPHGIELIVGYKQKSKA